MKFHTALRHSNREWNQLSVTELTVRKMFILSANKKNLECLIELQRSLINALNSMEPSSDP